MTLYPTPMGHVEIDCSGDRIRPVPEISIRRDPRPLRPRRPR
jgi:hypothetical protein